MKRLRNCQVVGWENGYRPFHRFLRVAETVDENKRSRLGRWRYLKRAVCPAPGFDEYIDMLADPRGGGQRDL